MNFSRIKDLRNPWFAALPLCLVFVMVFSSVSFSQSWEAKYEEIHNMYYNMGQQSEAIQGLEDQISSAGNTYSDAMLDRINSMSEPEPEVRPLEEDPHQGLATNGFLPIEPESFQEAGLSESEVELLILKFLLARGDAAGRDIADQIKLPFVLIDQLLRTMKND